jgi:hypothetical protein
MDDVNDQRFTTAALIAELEAADLPPLPKRLRKMIAEDSPMWISILEAILEEMENPGAERSPVDNLPAEPRAIARKLRDSVPLLSACALELDKRLRCIESELAALEKAIILQ